MSCTIYDAWEFNGYHDELIKFLNTLRKSYLKDCKKYINSLTPDLPELDKYEYERYVLKKIDEGFRSNEKGFPYDIDASAVIFEFNNKTIIYFFNLNDHIYVETKKEIKNKLKYFGWWDNTDPDEDCTEEEWHERENFYENLFESFDSDTPADCGLVYEFYRELEIFQVVCDIARERKMKR